ncbi:bacteriocin [Culturomica massiliensis]|nr:bacteriocin [Culturomica massiliensis]CCZ06553.1 unknown [Odoribacter sp. CAG:788]
MLEELNYKEMNQITGGQNVSAKEYCATLSMLIENNWGRWSEDERKSASDAYSKHC